MLRKALESVSIAIRRLKSRSHDRPSFQVSNEYDVQDLAEISLRAVFDDVVREEWTPQSAGSAKRVDLVVRSVGAFIECKYVRDRKHARRLGDELRVDFESYHEHPDCRQLFVLIHDPAQVISDPGQFAVDLNGLRRKRDHEFAVRIIVGS